MLKTSSIRNDRPSHRVAGFTLVEMLVSVALVLLMMSMFAQVFVQSTDSLTQQRGIAENDQRGRLLTTTIRNDLDSRTFRDIFPFRANEDTRPLGRSLSRRAGYFEYDEGNPGDDGDDVLSITTSVKIRLQSKDDSPFVGKAQPMSGTAIASVPANNTITINGNFVSYIAVGSRIWIGQSSGNNGSYFVSNSPAPSFGSGVTTITLNTSSLITSPTSPGFVFLSESDPEFDDGIFGNFTSTSSLAEVCYFLRNGILYRRVLLIRETPSGADSQPTWSTGQTLLWNGTNENYPSSGTSTTFWRDFDYSAFYFAGKTGPSGNEIPGVRFHSAPESLSNSADAPQIILDDTPSSLTFPLSLGIPHLRFGHSSSSGLPQDASTVVKLTTGQTVTIGRFTLQECSNTQFGYPGYLPNDPISGNPNTNPFNRSNIQVNPTTGLVVEYSGQTARRGDDVLLSNVLSFDIKILDPNTGVYVDLGDDSAPKVPSATAPTFGSNSPSRLNRTYGDNTDPNFPRFRFDTWHPLASVGTGPNDNQPPYVPIDATSGNAVAITSMKITINYRDISSNQIRQVSIIQSLVDRNKPPSLTDEPPEE